jgi:hypothetical protein
LAFVAKPLVVSGVFTLVGEVLFIYLFIIIIYVCVCGMKNVILKNHVILSQSHSRDFASL